MIIGLTGQTGAGKSTVSNILRENGFCIIDCDKIAKEVTVNNKELLLNLSACFGKEIINNDGSLNRKALANLAFSSKEKTELLKLAKNGDKNAREKMINGITDGISKNIISKLEELEKLNVQELEIWFCLPIFSGLGGCIR